MAAEESNFNLPTHILGIPIPFAILCGLSSAATMLFRYGEGLLGVGRNGIFAFLVMLAYGLAVPCPALMTYSVVFAGLVIVKRVIVFLCYASGYRQNSAFEGFPLPCLIGLPYGFCKQIVEPCLTYWLGWWLKFSDPALGVFFMASAAASTLKAAMEHIGRSYRELCADDARFQMERDARQRAKRGW